MTLTFMCRASNRNTFDSNVSARVSTFESNKWSPAPKVRWKKYFYAIKFHIF